MSRLKLTQSIDQLVKAFKDLGEAVNISTSMNSKDGVHYPVGHRYDAKGYLTKELKNGISNITYNSLNLPMKSVIGYFLSSAANIDVHAAGGTKLKTVL